MGDAIDRAVEKLGVKPGSDLEQLTRENIFNITGVNMDDAKIEKFIAEQRSAYPDSLLVPVRQQQEQQKPVNTLDLTAEQFQKIAAGELSVTK